ncbi:hypothetical protein ACG33_11340 [Steroidobacter denitrificans]|uniref:HTH hxlR-type domain-containing protein n=1 Tax=Steroidobacter denitrificans TaxID=465721 RepID=A0A127FB90_STEDE|nr:winged helix-turn-helix transcriptional regulator [Steroidobacter denitrificans]AMN47682.1 hypothetical protein ACG33_11340 [Steroidobacter denitrificans]
MMTNGNRTAGRSLIRAALDIVADYWTILLCRELYIGARQWSHFMAWLRVSPVTLSIRLKQIVKAGLVKTTSNSGSAGPTYELTQKGIDLFPFQMAIREWQLRWHPREDAFVTPWLHACGQPLRCYSVCHVCGVEPKEGTIRLVEREATLYDTKTSPRYRRLSSRTATDGRSKGLQPPRVVELWGDRCATIVIAALLRECHKFDELERWTQLSPATLAQRLRKLQIMGLVYMRLYQQKPDRFEYHLTPAGWDFMLPTLQLFRWAERWLAGGSRPFATHLECGQPLTADLLCKHCNGPVRLDNTHVDPRVLQISDRTDETDLGRSMSLV